MAKFRWRRLRRPTYVWRQLARLLLTKKKRMAAFRKTLKLDYAPPKQLSCQLARSRAHLEAAFRLLHDAYVAEGYMKPHPSGMRLTPYHALPSTSTAVALWGDMVIGTLSLIRDSGFGFPLEHIFDISEFRARGLRVTEVSSLAVSGDFRGQRGMVLWPLLKFAFNYCRRSFGTDVLVIAVNPKWIEFYQAVMGFQRITDQTVPRYDFVEGAPAVGAYLVLRDGYRGMIADYRGAPLERNFFHYIWEYRNDDLVRLPSRAYHKINDHVMTPNSLDYFFNQQSTVLRDLTPSRLKVLSAQYPDSCYDQVVSRYQGGECTQQRVEPRYDVACKGRIVVPGGRMITLTVRDASASGIQAVLESPLRFGDPVRINVAICEFEIADLTGRPVWTNNQGLYGFKIEDATKNWARFLDSLQRDSAPKTAPPQAL